MLNKTEYEIAHVRWQCRRGMLELDEILQNFLKKSYLQLSAEEKNSFRKLLECNDQDLYYWLLGQHMPDNLPLQKIIKKIRLSSMSHLREGKTE